MLRRHWPLRSGYLVSSKACAANGSRSAAKTAAPIAVRATMCVLRCDAGFDGRRAHRFPVLFSVILGFRGAVDNQAVDRCEAGHVPMLLLHKMDVGCATARGTAD